MEKQISAVDWIVDFFESGVTSCEEWTKAKEQAKQIEKEQIVDTAGYYFHERGKLTPEQYYHETFKS